MNERMNEGCVTRAVDCDDDTMTYRCSNDRCIARHLVNNSVNDCLDNSDEGSITFASSHIHHTLQQFWQNGMGIDHGVRGQVLPQNLEWGH